VIAPPSTDLTKTSHPWAVYLHHRARVLRWLHDQGKTPEQIVSELSMDPMQVRLILMTVEEHPETYDQTSPVPIPR